MAKNFGDADDREVPGVDNDVASGGAHEVSAGTEELNRRCLRDGGALPRWDGPEPRHHPSAQRLHELRPIHFSGRFPG